MSPLINLSATVGTLQLVNVTVYTQVSDMIVVLISVILLSYCCQIDCCHADVIVMVATMIFVAY